MLIQQAIELHLVNLHRCCPEAQEHLIPPHRAGSVEVWEGNVAEFMAAPFWSITTWGGNGLPIKYCPFCGETLPLEEDDFSGIDFDLIKGEE